MIAQFGFVLQSHILLPASAALGWLAENVEGEAVSVRLACAGDSEITFQVSVPASLTTGSDSTIDGEAAVEARFAVAEIKRVSFDRSNGRSTWDPPIEVALLAVNRMLQRLRVYSWASFLPLLPALGTTSWVTYLEDDRSPLPSDPDRSRRKISLAGGIGPVLTVTGSSWTEFQKVKDSQLTTWNLLLLDALRALPEVGPALVLALAAVETCGAASCEALARGQVPTPLWDWLASRRSLVVEQMLTKVPVALGGTSLHDDDPPLFDLFRELQMARNSFCHAGVATDHLGPVGPGRAAQLVEASDRILGWQEQYLPSNQRRPVASVLISSAISFPITRVGSPSPPSRVAGQAAPPAAPSGWN